MSNQEAPDKPEAQKAEEENNTEAAAAWLVIIFIVVVILGLLAFVGIGLSAVGLGM